MIELFGGQESRRPRMMVAKIGQDGRSAKVVATGLRRLGLRRRHRGSIPNPGRSA